MIVYCIHTTTVTTSFDFYRAMLRIAWLTGYEIACHLSVRLSVCLSVTFRYRDDIRGP